MKITLTIDLTQEMADRLTGLDETSHDELGERLVDEVDRPLRALLGLPELEAKDDFIESGLEITWSDPSNTHWISVAVAGI